MAGGTALTNVRGIISMGGNAPDTPLEGEDMVWLAFTPEGSNVEQLSDILRLGPGFTGYRDGLLQPQEDELVVNAMARLASDVAASGDDDAMAAPIGVLPVGTWENYVQSSTAMTLVQVSLTIEKDGTRTGRVGFRSTV
jgi:hypothetical protein